MPSGMSLFVAPVTPLTEDGHLQESAIRPLAKLLAARGAEGFYVGGGTGEGMLLRVDQRMRLLERWRDAVGPRVPLIAHISCSGAAESRVLARHAAEVGVVAVSAMGPSTVAPKDVNDLLDYFRSVLSSTPQTPFIYYINSNVAGGLKVSGHDFLTAAKNSFPNLTGIKFTHEDLADLSRCLRFAGGRYRMFYGRDEFLLAARAVGAKEFIGGAFNVLSPLARQVIDAFDAGNIAQARQHHHRLVDVVTVFRKFGGLSAVKAAMEMLGVDCGPLSPPLRTLTPTDKASLFAALEEAWPDIHKSSPVSAAPLLPLVEV